jgi:hypothetical protein
MDEKDAKYEHLLRTIAALTERVYKLEQQTGSRPISAPPISPPIAVQAREPERDQGYGAGLHAIRIFAHRLAGCKSFSAERDIATYLYTSYAKSMGKLFQDRHGLAQSRTHQGAFSLH